MSNDRRKPKGFKVRGSEVLVLDDRCFDIAVKIYQKISALSIAELRKREYFRPKLTRSARKRIGKAREIRRLAKEEIPEQKTE